MAGGQGTRFWPWSTEDKPKQFLNIVGDDPLITQTYNRLKHFLAEENIFIVADKKYLAAVKEAIPGFKDDNYIAEPCPKNTAPCLILANIVLARRDPDANVVVVPADHYIPDTETFADQFLDALALADEKYIVTSGIRPNMPHTGYGYINFSTEDAQTRGQNDFYNVVEFKEKPPLEVARQYVEAGNYYWNSGMFVYKLANFKELLAQYSPYYHRQYLALEESFEDKETFQRVFSDIEPESIDYALMEKAQEVRMFKAAFAWNDVGAWSSVYELGDKDDKQNVTVAKTGIFLDSKDSLLFSTGAKPVAVVGLEGVAVIETENGILVSHIDRLQEVKAVIGALKEAVPKP